MLPRKKVHFIGIVGRAMGGVAIALQQAGYEVTGSDPYPYPPMSDVLTAAGVSFHKGFKASRIKSALSAVIPGSRLERGNEELEAALAKGIPVASLPAFLAAEILPGRECWMIAGTNGKTTTSAMLAWILHRTGRRPGWLVGGLCPHLGDPFRIGRDKAFVLEGDEYGTSLLGDLNPKFLHYQPHAVGLLNVAADHPDYFARPADVTRAFSALLDRIPPQGLLAVNAEDPEALALSRNRHCRLLTVGACPGANRRITRLRALHNGSAFQLMGASFFLPLFGKMNVINAAVAAVLANEQGVSAKQCAVALSEFLGVAERQATSYDEGGFVHVGDPVYHPSALCSLIQAMRHRFKKRRIIVVFQPRSTGPRHWPFQAGLAEALSGADGVLLLPAINPVFLDPGKPFSIPKLAADIRRAGVAVRVSRKIAIDSRHLRPLLRPGDAVISCVQPSVRGKLMDSINTVLRTFTD